MASAQNSPAGAQNRNAQQGAAQQSEQHSSQPQSGAAQGSQKMGTQESGRTPVGGRQETTGQAPSNAREGSQEQRGPATEKTGPNPDSSAQEHNNQRQPNPSAAVRDNREPNQRTGQQQRDPNQRTAQPEHEQNQRTGQQPSGQTPDRAQNQRGDRNEAPASSAQRAGQRDEGRQDGVTLSSEQRTRIRDTVLSGRDVPRVGEVNFALNVGTAVPANVRIVEVPDTLIEIYPEWRGDSYFVVRDEIIIVDHNRDIVATLPTGSSSARLSERGGSGGVNLDQAQIREVQIELRRQGFAIGEADGVLGPRTRDAVIAFQKRRGFQATGEIDHETFTALGTNERQGGGVRGEQSPGNERMGQNRNGTTGQASSGRDARPQPSNTPSDNQRPNVSSGASQDRTQNSVKDPGSEPRTTGQSNGGARQGGNAPARNETRDQK